MRGRAIRPRRSCLSTPGCGKMVPRRLQSTRPLPPTNGARVRRCNKSDTLYSRFTWLRHCKSQRGARLDLLLLWPPHRYLDLQHTHQTGMRESKSRPAPPPLARCPAPPTGAPAGRVDMDSRRAMTSVFRGRPSARLGAPQRDARGGRAKKPVAPGRHPPTAPAGGGVPAGRTLHARGGLRRGPPPDAAQTPPRSRRARRRG